MKNEIITNGMLTDIIGREQEIEELRLILENSSIVMSSTRRMGKTMILTKMDGLDHPETKTMLCFIESVQSAEEFVNILRDKLIEQKLLHESDFRKLLKWLNDNLGQKDFGIFKTPEFKSHWKKILNLMMDDLVEKHTDLVVLMMDEFPKMLWNLIQNGNYLQAEEILDELRNIRERQERRSKLRFIYCGSIGMSLVIKYLVQKHKYSGSPLNNMHHYIVHEMNFDDATQLVNHLATKNKLKIETGLDSYLAKACSCMPFFIDRIIVQLKLSPEVNSISRTVINKTIDDFISGRDNNTQFNHFTERIDVYYYPKEKKIAHELLKILCKSEGSVSSDELLRVIKTTIESDDFEIFKILTDLYEDMYIDRNSEGDLKSYSFRFKLLKKWWKLNYT